jgi:hypothetical protein
MCSIRGKGYVFDPGKDSMLQHFPNGDKTKSRLCLWPYSRAGCDLDANLEEFSSADL